MTQPADKPQGRGAGAEFLLFLRSLKTTPKLTGAIAPSGAALSRLMASFVDPKDDRPVLELGPGTGVVTAALLERGVAPERIISIEYNPDFCIHLRRRFPGVRVIEGDAYDLNRTLRDGHDGAFSAVVSSLPLLTRPPAIRHGLVEGALSRIPVGAPLIQFSYSLTAPPVPATPGRFSVTSSRWVLMNLPPARVWLYRRA